MASLTGTEMSRLTDDNGQVVVLIEFRNENNKVVYTRWVQADAWDSDHDLIVAKAYRYLQKQIAATKNIVLNPGASSTLTPQQAIDKLRGNTDND